MMRGGYSSAGDGGRSAVTSSPDARLNEAHGLGIRPNIIFWIGCPVAEFMMVAMILIIGPVPGGAAVRLWLDRRLSTSGQYDTCLHVRGSFTQIAQEIGG